MNDGWLSFEYVTVAIAFDQRTEGLISAGATVARRMGKRLAFVHCVEGWADRPVSRAFGETSPLWDVTQAIERSSTDVARARLEEAMARIESDLRGPCVVTAGKPTETIGQAALDIGSCLLVVGVDFDQSRFVPKGLSVALSLLADAPVPIAAIDPARPSMPSAAQGSDEPMRILAADDLTNQSEAAIDYAMQIATAMPQSWLHHVHVNALTQDVIAAGLDTAMAAAHASAATPVSADMLHRALCEQILTTMQQRVADQLDYLEEARGRYTFEILEGPVQAELDALTGDFIPDLLVFGRHKSVHAKPFYLGRMPYRAMLKLQRPIIVVPEE